MSLEEDAKFQKAVRSNQNLHFSLLPSNEEPQEEPPTESQDITTYQEKKDEGAPEVQGPDDPDAHLQELAQPKTGSEDTDGPDIKGKILPNLEPSEVPEAEPDQETSLQDLPQLNTGDEGRDGPDVKEDI
ncbi:X antigen family member 5-like [Rhinolophus sinicus]|uniref:X antigen family member 5-like n=1 Tax=Rhinolophus sinicus TaxID=89399 RepID=UPI003D7BD9AC